MGTYTTLAVSFCFVATVWAVAVSRPSRNRTPGLPCEYENVTYRAGQRFRPNACTFCRCSRKGGRAMCAMIDCAWEPHCLRFNDDSAVCCPRCLEYGCIHTDGIAYAKGVTITETPCERCYCPMEGGRTVCDMEPCPNAVCVEPLRKEGGCCDTCPNGKRAILTNYLADTNT